MIHFDHAATSLPRAPAALAAAAHASTLPTPGRGLHSAQEVSSAIVSAARSSIANLLPPGRVIVFTCGATAALSQAILGVRPTPRHVAHDPLLHNAVRRPLARLAAQGTTLSTLAHDARGRIDLTRVAREWRNDTEWVVITHGSNVSGLVQPVAELVDIAHARGARVIVDAAQTAGLLIPLPVGDADVVAFSAHKGLAGLPGAGVLAIASRGDFSFEPLVVGGTGFDSERDEMPVELPARLEAGTPNLPGIAAAGAAAEIATAAGQNVATLGAQCEALVEALRAGGVTLLTSGQDLPIALVRLRGLRPLHAEELLDRSFGIITRAGTHCAPLAHATLHTGELGALRVSAGRLTAASEFDALTRALRAIMDDPALTAVEVRS